MPDSATYIENVLGLILLSFFKSQQVTLDGI